MTCIAITRGGFGSILRFENEDVAFLHPVVQYGDAIIRKSDDLPDLYNRIEWHRLMTLAGYENKLLVEGMVHLSVLEIKAAKEQSSRQIWDLLERKAVEPPSDLAGITAMVVADRRAVDLKEQKKMTAETTEQTVAKKSTGDFDPNSIIHFGTPDAKEGEPAPAAWGPTNCPYRADSKRSGRWAKLRHGMTVQEAVENGQSVKNISDMTQRGFIKLVPVAAQHKNAA